MGSACRHPSLCFVLSDSLSHFLAHQFYCKQTYTFEDTTVWVLSDWSRRKKESYYLFSVETMHFSPINWKVSTLPPEISSKSQTKPTQRQIFQVKISRVSGSNTLLVFCCLWLISMLHLNVLTKHMWITGRKVSLKCTCL